MKCRNVKTETLGKLGIASRNFLALVAFFSLPLAAVAATPNHITIALSNTSEAVNWYEEHMDCQPIAGRDNAVSCGTTEIEFLLGATVGGSQGTGVDHIGFSVTDLDDSSTLYKKMTSFGEKMLLENLPLIENKSAHRKKQDNSKFIEIWPKRTKEDGKINWNETCIEIHKLIRATTHPYPGAFTNFKNKELIIWKSNYLDDSICEPGVIKEIHDEFILVGTGYGSIKILEASYDNKNDLSKIFLDDDIGTQLS